MADRRESPEEERTLKAVYGAAGEGALPGDAPVEPPSASDAVASGPAASLPEETPGEEPVAPEDGAPKEPRKHSRRDSLLEVAIVVLVALFLALLLKIYVAEAYMIRGHSMEPTFVDGQRVMVQKVFYEIQRGDVIIFSSKFDRQKDLIKRVIELPGDTVRVTRRGEVFVNGKKLEEDYIRTAEFSGGRGSSVVVPDNTYFVLGDNRPESQDSRNFDSIDGSSIKGKVFLRWWPFQEFRTF